MFKTALVPIVGVVVLALMFGCVRDVKTESAADFSLASGQTWDWVPDKVETWQDYKRDARQARINVHDAYAEQRHETRETGTPRPKTRSSSILSTPRAASFSGPGPAWATRAAWATIQTACGA